MHPILRIFGYQTDASLSVLGQCGSYGQGGGLAAILICEHYEVRTLVGECAHHIVQGQCGRTQCYRHCQGLDKRVFHLRYLVRITCAYIRRPATKAMNK